MLANPWLILAAVLAFACITGGAYLKGRGDGADGVIARQARDDQVRFETLQLAQQGAAEAIAAIEVKNVTYRQTLDREIVRVPDYSQCKHSPDGMSAINAALTGAEPEPVDDRQLPAADKTHF